MIGLPPEPSWYCRSPWLIHLSRCKRYGHPSDLENSLLQRSAVKLWPMQFAPSTAMTRLPRAAIIMENCPMFAPMSIERQLSLCRQLLRKESTASRTWYSGSKCSPLEKSRHTWGAPNRSHWRDTVSKTIFAGGMGKNLGNSYDRLAYSVPHCLAGTGTSCKWSTASRFIHAYIVRPRRLHKTTKNITVGSCWGSIARISKRLITLKCILGTCDVGSRSSYILSSPGRTKNPIFPVCINIST